jgi:hypothetical protein
MNKINQVPVARCGAESLLNLNASNSPADQCFMAAALLPSDKFGWEEPYRTPTSSEYLFGRSFS